MKGRIISLLLAGCLILTLLFPFPALSVGIVDRGECGAEGAAVTWTLDATGLLVFQGQGAMCDYELERGALYYYNNQSYTARHTAAPWFSYRDFITSVEVSDGITHIGENAFYGNSNLSTAPDYRFDSICDISIAESVESIGESAFARCVALEELNFAGSRLASIGKDAFNGCEALERWTISENVREIGADAFKDCAALTLLVYSGSYAQEYAVKNNLRHSVVDAGTEPGGVYVASGSCGANQAEELRWTLYEEGLLSFSGSGMMTDYQPLRGESYTRNGSNYYASHTSAPWYEYRDQIASAEIPEGVTRIGAYAFFGNPPEEAAPRYRFDKLTQLALPSTLREIGNYAFARCTALPGVSLPYGVSSVGDGAFQDCVGLSQIHLPETLLSLGASVFRGCTGLRELRLPESLTFIGKEAFAECPDLVLYVYRDSYALRWAQENKVRCRIVEASDVSVDGVDVVPAALRVAIGQTALLTATLHPSNAWEQGIVWRSTNETVATVDGYGTVRGATPGTAEIMAITVDGQKTARSTVTVTEQIHVQGVLLDRGRLGLEIGQSAALHASVLPEDASNQKIFWSSSNRSVASVDENGLVTLHADGEAVISATSEDGGKSTFCVVTTPVAATGIQLNRTSMNLRIGETDTLAASILPEGATNSSVTWESFNPFTAQVTPDGAVTGKAEGTTYISAISQDGLYVALCRVTVRRDATPATGIHLSQSNVDALPEGTSISLSAVVFPADAADQTVSWFSSNPAIAAVSANGVVTAVTTGTAIVTAVSADGGFSAGCTVTVPNPGRKPDSLLLSASEDFLVPRGSPLNLPGLLVQAVYGEDSEIVTDYTVSGYDANKLGQQIVSISYQGSSASLSVTVTEAALFSLSISRLPDKLRYVIGERLNLDGMVLTAAYTNGSTAEFPFSASYIPPDVSTSGFQSDSTGTRVVEISYGSESVYFSVSVSASAQAGESEIEAPRMNIRAVEGGKYVELIATPGTEIYYTTDNTPPSLASQRYSSPILLTESTTIRAAAVSGSVFSNVTMGTISIDQTAAVFASEEDNARLPSGSVIALESHEEGAAIYYTVDGSEPNSGSPRYSSGIVISTETTVKAIAVKEGFRDSEVLTRHYQIYSNSADSMDSATISIGSVSSRAGETISAPIYIFTNSEKKITDFCFTIEYDRGVFSYASVTPVEGMPWDGLMVSADPDGKMVTVRYMADASGTSTNSAIASGEMFTLNLRALDSAEDGRYALKLTQSRLSVRTESGAPLVTFTSGLITLSGSHNSQLSGSVTFTDSAQKEVTDLSSGTEGLSATFSLDAFVPENSASQGAVSVIVDVFLAVYDRQGLMVDLEVWNVPLSNMASVFMQAIRIPNHVEAGTIKIMIFSEDMTPMMAASALENPS